MLKSIFFRSTEGIVKNLSLYMPELTKPATIFEMGKWKQTSSCCNKVGILCAYSYLDLLQTLDHELQPFLVSLLEHVSGVGGGHLVAGGGAGAAAGGICRKEVLEVGRRALG